MWYQIFAIFYGYPFQFSSFQRLYYNLRGIRRLQGKDFSRPNRQPITKQHLFAIKHFLVISQYRLPDKIMLWSMCTLAFFGLLRVSEYTSPTPSTFNSSLHLTFSDVTFDNGFLIVFIKASKTDPFRQGCHIRIAPSYTDFCPVLAIQHYLRIRPFRVSAPLFIFDNGTFLTR